MPNDAKLGLLVGVIGVIAVAVMSTNKLPHPQATANANVPTAVQKAPAPRADESPVKQATQPTRQIEIAPEPQPVPVPTALPMELPSTPVVRTKREPVVTPASRTRDEDVEP